MSNLRTLVAALVVCALLSSGVQAAAIYDVSVLLAKQHTLIDFETNGHKQAITIAENDWMLMPADEYVSYGVTFSPQVKWVNDNSSEFDAAQAIGGSPNNAIPGVGVDSFDLLFTKTVEMFGFWVVHNNRAAQRPVFEAYDENDVLIEVVTFAGAAIDGMISSTGGPDGSEYGFLGIEGSRPIKRVRVTKKAAILDNLMFSPPIPEPTSASLFLLIGTLAIRRRRRQ